jgi:hypothetical protein
VKAGETRAHQRFAVLDNTGREHFRAERLAFPAHRTDAGLFIPVRRIDDQVPLYVMADTEVVSLD